MLLSYTSSTISTSMSPSRQIRTRTFWPECWLYECYCAFRRRKLTMPTHQAPPSDEASGAQGVYSLTAVERHFATLLLTGLPANFYKKSARQIVEEYQHARPPPLPIPDLKPFIPLHVSTLSEPHSPLIAFSVCHEHHPRRPRCRSTRARVGSR